MKNYLSLIKFTHTIFAMPFALLGFFLGSHQTGQGLSWRLLALVVLCMVFARSAAMAFNRYLDRDIDAKNPRTAIREIPAGVISPKAALAFVVANCLLFVGAAYFINPLCFYLSPVALLVVLGYSYTKRFTPLCHLVLGAGLALAPLGAYLAAGGGFDTIPILYAFAVLLWVAGFDIIYALQDEEFDKSMRLNSIPAKVGKARALQISKVLHIVSASLIVVNAYLLYRNFGEFGWLNWAAASVFIVLLAYQHSLVRPNDLRKVNLAFFTTNGLASLTFSALLIVDLFF